MWSRAGLLDLVAQEGRVECELELGGGRLQGGDDGDSTVGGEARVGRRRWRTAGETLATRRRGDLLEALGSWPNAVAARPSSFSVRSLSARAARRIRDDSELTVASPESRSVPVAGAATFVY